MQKISTVGADFLFYILPEGSDDFIDFFGHALNNTSHIRSK